MPVLAPLLLLLLLATAPGAAQDQSDSTAYRGLTQTPLNGFSPLPGVSLLGEGPAGFALHARYGLMSFRNRDYIHNLGVGLGFPFADGELTLTAGAYNPSCPRDDCPGHFMASVEYEQGLAGLPLGREGRIGDVNIGIRTGFGLGTPDDATLYSGSASLQVSLVPRSEGTRIYPFVAPGLGFGLVTSDDGTDAGMLPVLGGGVGLLTLRSRLGVTAGVHRAFMSGGNWLAGLNLRVGLGGGGASSR